MASFSLNSLDDVKLDLLFATTPRALCDFEMNVHECNPVVHSVGDGRNNSRMAKHVEENPEIKACKSLFQDERMNSEESCYRSRFEGLVEKEMTITASKA